MSTMLGIDLPMNTHSVTIRPASGNRVGRPPDVWNGPATTSDSDVCSFLGVNKTLRDWAKANNKIIPKTSECVLDFMLVCYSASNERIDEFKAEQVNIVFGRKKKKQDLDVLDVSIRRSQKQDELIISYLEKRDAGMLAAMEKMHTASISAVNNLGSQIVGIVTQQSTQQKEILSLAITAMNKTEEARDCLTVELKMGLINAQKQLTAAKTNAGNADSLDSMGKVLGVANNFVGLAQKLTAGDKAESPKLTLSENATTTADKK